MNRDELMHTAIYHGDEFSDELYHWKYIDKYKNKLGKWIYVYKKKAEEKIKNVTGIGMKNDIYKAQAEVYKAEEKAKIDNNNIPVFLRDVELPPGVRNYPKEIADRSNRILQQKQNKLNKLQEQYNRTIAGIAESTINKGKAFIKKLFD